jgi:two-component system NtrC family response regulator/two-component system response regulator HydG/two-component system response regulator AtoC
MCQSGAFREDLYYRIHVLRIEVPPLRERPEDIEPLVRHFLSRFKRDTGKDIQGIDKKALAVLKAYPWPGNVRELANIVERCAVLSDGPIVTQTHLPVELLGAGASASAEMAGTLAHRVELLERQMISDAMRKARGKKVTAARMLGISRPTLDKKLSQYGIDIFRD